jgi:hypothetical protein
MGKDTLSAMLSQYENSSSSYAKSESSKVYDLKNYFTTHLTDKQKSATKRIRIVPTQDGSSPFVQIHGHKMQVDGDWKTFVCLKHQKDEDCPFCEAQDALRATGKEQDKELAKKYSARKMYVVKIIDRDNEADGIKFWRFNHDYRKQGILDKIYGVLQAVNKDITDPQTGRDLLVMLARDQGNRPIVQSISHVDPSPLSDDADLAAEWLADARTWEDVYAVKSYDYLEIVVKGGIPTWDKEAKKFVDKASVTVSDEVASLDEELSLGVSNVKSTVSAAKTTQPVATKTTPVVEENSEVEDDDLPF